MDTAQAKSIGLTVLLTAMVIFSSQSIITHYHRPRSPTASPRPLMDAPTSLKTSAAASSASDPVAKHTNTKKISEIIIKESLARNYAYFGDHGMAKIRHSFVVIVGLGGVGSATATMLVRSGVGKLRIIDFDQVSLSSLNRHSTATLADVGTPKVTCCAEYFKSVAPWVVIDPRVALFEKGRAAELLEGKPDFVIDCIDNIESKIELIAYCYHNQIPVFSALGAAAKCDPSRVQVSDISCTFEDPLARVVRRRLRLEGVPFGVPVVYSTEKPRAEIGLLPLPEDEYQAGKVGELSALPNFRVRILPVVGPLPAMFGNAAATYVLSKLAGFEMETLAYKNRMKLAFTMHKSLQVVEGRLTGNNKISISEDDALYYYEEIHRGRSVAPPHVVAARPTLLRWKKEHGLNWDNIVIFEREEGQRHTEHCLYGDEDPEVFWGPEVTALVNKRTAEERRLRKYRF